MCLAIPMRITAIDGFNARCEAKGVHRDVSLFMLQDDLPRLGDFVAVQVGYAVRRVDEDEARQAWELFDQILKEFQA
ncbi:MAG: HypC/HybG/HupF family hydrogenase formation chaperone [Thiobacillus sp.]|nr:HypC/HybG/HupF family hydrogenase formation chaperone [Thiobacillus sp.]